MAIQPLPDAGQLIRRLSMLNEMRRAVNLPALDTLPRELLPETPGASAEHLRRLDTYNAMRRHCGLPAADLPEELEESSGTLSFSLDRERREALAAHNAMRRDCGLAPVSTLPASLDPTSQAVSASTRAKRFDRRLQAILASR